MSPANNSQDEWLIALGSALAGAVVGAGASYLGSLVRDRRMWARQDAAAMRRLSGEVRYSTEIAATRNLDDPPGQEIRAQTRAAAAQLRSFLDDGALEDDDAAGVTRAALDEVRQQIDSDSPDLDKLRRFGETVSTETEKNVLRRAESINPKPSSLKSWPPL